MGVPVVEISGPGRRPGQADGLADGHGGRTTGHPDLDHIVHETPTVGHMGRGAGTRPTSLGEPDAPLPRS